MDDVRMLLDEQLRGGPPSSQVSVDRAIADGRIAVRRRRITASFSSVLVVTLVALSVVWLARPGHEAPTGVLPATSPPSVPVSRPPVPPPPTGPPGRGSVALLTGGGVVGGPATVHLAGGGAVTLPTPPGTAIQQVTKVPSGWLYTADVNADPQHPTPSSGWFLPTGGTPRKVADDGGDDLGLSGDGTMLAVGANKPGAHAYEVVLYALPSFNEITRTTFDTTGTMAILRFTGDWILVGGVPRRVPNQLWNVRTGQVTTFGDGRATLALDVSEDGRVLRRIEPPAGSSGAATTCFDVVTPGAAAPPATAGHCLKAAGGSQLAAWMSPSGDWVVIRGAGQVDVVRTGDLVNGRWAPTVVDALPNDILLWGFDTDTTFVVVSGTGANQRCAVTGGCTALPDHGGLDSPVFVAGS